jgi:signal peptide peptidase SppA
MTPLALLTPKTPWAILPDVMPLIKARLFPEPGMPDARYTYDRDKNGDFGLVDKSILTVGEDGIATISITGPLMRNPGIFREVVFGATDFDEIEAAAHAARADANVRGVFLDINSPGGTVNGTPETGDAIRALADAKPVYAFTSGLMCSAAYWLASQAHVIHCTPSATVGSIGVVVGFLDASKAYEMHGYKMEVFASGKFKGAGMPGTSLTDEQREQIRATVMEINDDFRAAVLSRGRAIKPEAMEGQTFMGRAAAKENLAALVPSRAESIARLATRAKLTRS